MAYATIPGRENEYGVIGGVAGTGGVVEGTFAAFADGTITTATSGALNVGVVLETADAGDQTSLKMVGFAILSVNGSTAIAAGDGLDPTTAGVGIKAAADHDIPAAIALGAATTATHIPVLLGQFTVSA